MEPATRSQVIELHDLVREWAKVGSMTGAVPMPFGENPTVAYVDLMFAYGLARMGEVEQSTKLAESARVALEKFPAETDKGIAGRFFYEAFKYRIDQAAAGHSLSGRLSTVLLDELAEIDRKSGGKANSTFGMAHFVITRMMVQSRILEPFERPDPYKRFTTPHEGSLKQALYELIDERDPERLVANVRELYRRSGAGPAMTVEQFDVLRESLPLSGRVGAEFAAELIRLVPDALRQTYPKQFDPLHKRAELLDCGFSLVGHFGHRDLAVLLVEAFTECVTASADDDRVRLINMVAGPCVRCLLQLGLRVELDGVLQRLLSAVLDGRSLSDLQVRLSDQREPWMRMLQTLLGIAGGLLALGRTEQANPILDEAQVELLSAPSGKPIPQDHTRLATAYIAAVGHGPTESGFQRLIDLFSKIHPAKILNSFNTAPFFSRFHLEVVEEVVLAILEMLPSEPHSISR